MLWSGKRFSFGLQGVRPIFPWFYSKQRFYLCLAKLRCSRILLLRTTFSSSFVRKLHIWRSILPGKCFGLLATKLGCFEPYLTKNAFLFPVFREWPWFLFDCPQTHVLACVWPSYSGFSMSFLRTTFATFPYMKYVFDALTYRKYVLVRLQKVRSSLG